LSDRHPRSLTSFGEMGHPRRRRAASRLHPGSSVCVSGEGAEAGKEPRERPGSGSIGRAFADVARDLPRVRKSDAMVGTPAFETLHLETPRLILRPPRLEDLDAWATFMSDPEAARFIGGTASRSMTWRAIMTMIGSWHAHGFAMFSVIEKATGRWIGRVGPWMPEGWPGSEIGWSIVRDCWGRGFATEAASVTADWAFDHLGWTEMIHSIAPDNTASQGVARKLGSHNRGPGQLPPPYDHDRVDIWGQTRAHWQARQARSTDAAFPAPSDVGA
jgi:RimJ/RimL family protein N-acetyltransferase